MEIEIVRNCSVTEIHQDGVHAGGKFWDTDPFDCDTPRHACGAPQSQRLRSKAIGRPQGAFVAIGIGKLSSGSPVMFNDRDRNPFAAQFIACGLQVGDIEPKFGCVFFCRFYPNMRRAPGSIIK